MHTEISFNACWIPYGSPMSIFALLLRANHKSDGKVKLENNFSIVFNMYI